MGSIILKAARRPADLPLRESLNFPVSINILRIRKAMENLTVRRTSGEVRQGHTRKKIAETPYGVAYYCGDYGKDFFVHSVIEIIFHESTAP